MSRISKIYEEAQGHWAACRKLRASKTVGYRVLVITDRPERFSKYEVSTVRFLEDLSQRKDLPPQWDHIIIDGQIELTNPDHPWHKVFYWFESLQARWCSFEKEEENNG